MKRAVKRQSPTSVRIVNCPRCGAGVVWSAASPYRPFCSERCRLVDLGKWADESYRIPVAENKDRTDTDDAYQGR